MGAIHILLCLVLAHSIVAGSAIRYLDAVVSQDFARFFEHMRPPNERNFDLVPFDTIFSSWGSRAPDFHLLGELPPIMTVPKVKVFCDDSKMTLLVDKRTNGLTLTGEEIQLGNGCYSNRELPDQLIFDYGFDQCGTTREVQNGLERFTNSLHLNLKQTLPTWWQTFSTIYISCVPKRPYYSPQFVSRPPADDGSFCIRAMNSSWTSAADSNVYKRGQGVNLQVFAKTRPDQQLFIQSCFVSASPEPQTRPRHAVVMNKGCSVAMHAHHAVVQFVASNRADVVNFALNTSYLISELYVHCSVVISDQGVTFSSKSCNYNPLQSRWEELSGVEVCDCCSSKCKGLPEARTFVSAGPFVVVDEDSERSPERLYSEPQAHTDIINSHPEDSVTAQIQTSNGASNDIPELRPPTYQESPLNNPTNEIHLFFNEQKRDAATWDLNLLTMVDGWPILPQDEPVIVDDFQRKNRLERSVMFNDIDFSVPVELGVILVDKSGRPDPCNSPIAEECREEKSISAEMNRNDVRHNVLNKMRETDAAVMPEEYTYDDQPIIRSKLEFSKVADGSQVLSYEEEVKQQGGTERRREPRLKGFRSTFLDLLRRMDKAE
ncbi:zona pellucida protein C [Mugil cephalus]|uniref:zona pellucida protein C n=1 Tax=Mugil cephalus TaxID=48193 RepID=UPI001FB7850D|nr:zona pellucida protein C [Mugil cephalus]